MVIYKYIEEGIDLKVLVKCVFILAAVFMLMPAGASAHTGLKSSTPASGEKVQSELKQIELEFNTNVENLSTFTLVDEQGLKMPVTVTLEGSVMRGTLNNELTSGNYTIMWKIVGEDGHPIKGEVPFVVELPAVDEQQGSEPTETEDQPVGEGEGDAALDPESSLEEQPSAPEDGLESNGDVTSGEGKSASPAVYLISGFVLFFVVAGIASLIMKRRKT